MTNEEIRQLKDGDLVWVAINRREARAMYFCELREDGALMEDWSCGFPIHCVFTLDRLIARYKIISSCEEHTDEEND